MMAQQAITEHMGQEFDVMKVTRAKYIKGVTPGIPVTVIWAIKEQEDAFICKCTLETEGNLASKLTMTLTSKQN
jgi:hypothetical protein